MNLIQETVSKMVQAVMDGDESACEVYALLKNARAQIESGIKVIEDGAINEALQFTKGEIYFGGLWEFRGSPTYLDFSEDEMYVELSGKLSARKKSLNQAWKASQDNKIFLDSETGEQTPVLSVKTPSKEMLIYKKK